MSIAKEQLRIIFLGTPEFAVHILDGLIQQNYNVVGVITAPDRPAGRGQKVKQSAVISLTKPEVSFLDDKDSQCQSQEEFVPVRSRKLKRDNNKPQANYKSKTNKLRLIRILTHNNTGCTRKQVMFSCLDYKKQDCFFYK